MKHLVFRYDDYYPRGGARDFLGFKTDAEIAEMLAEPESDDLYWGMDNIQVVNPETLEIMKYYHQGVDVTEKEWWK